MPLQIPFWPGRNKKPAFQPGWLAFARDEHGLRWVHVVQAPGDDKAQVLAWEHLPPEADLARQLGAVSMKGRLKRHRCLVTLHADEYQIVQAELPAVPEEEMRQALRWSVRELLEYDVQDLGIDYLEVPGDKARGGAGRPAYVVCAMRPSLQRYVDAFSSIKARLHVSDVPETAHRNLAARCDVAGHGTALLGVMPDHSLLTFTHEGELCMSRRIEVGLLALERASAGERPQLLDRMLLEVQRSLDAFERQFHFAPLSRLLVSPLPDEIDLVPFLIDNLYQKVEQLDLTQYFDFSEVADLLAPQSLASCLTLLGAGLRDESALEVG